MSDESVEDDELAVPPHLGKDLDPVLKKQLHHLLLDRSSQLGSVYRAMVEHPGAGPTELLPFTTCANTGVVGNRRVIVYAVLDGTTPDAPSVALQAARTVRTLIKRSIDPQVIAHLEAVLTRLVDRAGSEEAVEAENVQLATESAKLQQDLQTAAGVYVYTYPHYWRHPYIADTERRLLKIGRTKNQAWNRVLSQARRTGMPEDPVLLRVYKTGDPTTAERHFHALLDAAEHQRTAGIAVGTEWFVTTIDFCDAIAGALGYEVLKGSVDE
ncbi:GIY-YIG nuclease family protein [Paenibacillus sp. TRM 82003]|uniref:GIY-YIG nuclease family protein n=1 Tax=Kineococcus sp. TRM81007 TaxID=2925831 RepID=UPI001F5A8655|nr:GIY-YIG nuclease family protein [Kineococcus sp. TRM81007]MCI2237078.1 GIY-YIG nuclease family protein [Kineococcus sp. TRM81007]MCI3926452.1 GIY-YIG nuclease family protein [Paenibacillus sp. TRM 82003]